MNLTPSIVLTIGICIVLASILLVGLVQ